MQRLFQMNLKALDACSLKSVDKVQLYDVYNHYLHCNALFIYLSILLENIVYYYIVYDFWLLCDVFMML